MSDPYDHVSRQMGPPKVNVGPEGNIDEHNIDNRHIKDGKESNHFYCERLVKLHDPNHFYALHYASTLDRQYLLGLYAMQVEIRNIISVVSEPGLGEIRFQWWRDNLDALQSGVPPREHPVLQQLALYFTQLARKDNDKISGQERDKKQLSENGTLADQNQKAAFDHHASLMTLIDARSRLLYDAPFESVEALYDWFILSEGSLAGAAAHYGGAPKSKIDLIQNLHALLWLAREVSSPKALPSIETLRLAPDLEQREIVEFIHHRFAGLKKSLGDIPQPLIPIILPVSLIPVYLKRKPRVNMAIHRHLKYFKCTLSGRLS